MWKTFRSTLPHAPIVLANMYVVLFLIDRVNTSMNFIDNDLTKGVLLAMCLLAIIDWLLAPRGRRGRSTAARALAALAAGLSAVCLLALAADRLMPDWSLFLMEAVKWYVLATCAAVIVGSGALLKKSRSQLRRKLQRARRRARG